MPHKSVLWTACESEFKAVHSLWAGASTLSQTHCPCGTPPPSPRQHSPCVPQSPYRIVPVPTPAVQASPCTMPRGCTGPAPHPSVRHTAPALAVQVRVRRHAVPAFSGATARLRDGVPGARDPRTAPGVRQQRGGAPECTASAEADGDAGACQDPRRQRIMHFWCWGSRTLTRRGGMGGGATPAQPASGGGCLPQPRWAVCATRAGAYQGQTRREGEKDIWWTAGTARGGTGHLGLTHTETQRGRLWTACGQRRVGSKNSQTTPATTSTSSIRQLLGAADTQTAHHATFSTAPTHQLLGSANAETTPARAPAAAADRKQRPDATCEGKNG